MLSSFGRFVSITLLAAVLIFQAALPLQASGSLTTSEANKPGQVTVKNENGIIYLTTETNPDPNNPAPSQTETRGIPGSILRNVNIRIPEGFAENVGGLLNGILSFVMVIAALLVLFFLIWGAFDWITSGGDKGATDKARQKITAAVIGLIIVAASYAILNLVIQFLGFRNLNDVFDSAGTINGGADTTSSSQSELGRLNEVNAPPTPTPTPTPAP